jgi:hypothetical protein
MELATRVLAPSIPITKPLPEVISPLAVSVVVTVSNSTAIAEFVAVIQSSKLSVLATGVMFLDTVYSLLCEQSSLDFFNLLHQFFHIRFNTIYFLEIINAISVNRQILHVSIDDGVGLSIDEISRIVGLYDPFWFKL